MQDKVSITVKITNIYLRQTNQATTSRKFISLFEAPSHFGEIIALILATVLSSNCKHLNLVTVLL